MIFMTVGQRIKKRRKKLGLSVDKIAEKSGKNPRQHWEVLTGKYNEEYKKPSTENGRR